MSSEELLPEPASATAALAPAIQSLGRLADVLGRENAALKARDSTRMRRLLEEKQAALLACERWLDSEDRGAGAILADDAFEALKSRLDGLAAETSAGCGSQSPRTSAWSKALRSPCKARRPAARPTPATAAARPPTAAGLGHRRRSPSTARSETRIRPWPPI